jgi:ribosomal-protein-serine acetyltransferase
MKPILRDIPEQFTTERLLIRTPRPGDGPLINAATHQSLDELRPWMPWAMGDVPVAETEEYVRHAYANFLTRRDLPLLLLQRETGAFIGGSGLHRIDWDVPKFEIGYWCSTPFTGLGYITEAVNGLTAFAFTTLGARRVEIRCSARNERSAAVARRCGYTQEAIFPNYRRSHFTEALESEMVFAKTR